MIKNFNCVPPFDLTNGIVIFIFLLRAKLVSLNKRIHNLKSFFLLLFSWDRALSDVKICLMHYG